MRTPGIFQSSLRTTLVENLSIPMDFLTQAHGTRFELIFHFKRLFSFSVMVFHPFKYLNGSLVFEMCKSGFICVREH